MNAPKQTIYHVKWRTWPESEYWLSREDSGYVVAGTPRQAAEYICRELGLLPSEFHVLDIALTGDVFSNPKREATLASLGKSDLVKAHAERLGFPLVDIPFSEVKA